MAPQNSLRSNTGPAILPDVGVVNYNGCVFSSLFSTKLNGVMVKDSANRTTKYVDYTITVDGYVTLPDGAADIGPTMVILRRFLTQQGGTFIYKGRGCDIVIRQVGNPLNNLADVAWGPVPQLLDFQPLGGGLSAKVVWQVKVRIPEIQARQDSRGKGRSRAITDPLLQFCYDVTVIYGEDGYSSISCSGSLEIPMTRVLQSSRVVVHTADDFREEVGIRLMSSIDLSRFRVTRRNFKTSQDKRTLEWNFELEEKPYMDLPPFCTIAKGNFSVRQARQGMGNVSWMCTLRATYTVMRGAPHNAAWLAFLRLLQLRMMYAAYADITSVSEKRPEAQNPDPPAQFGRFDVTFGINPLTKAVHKLPVNLNNPTLLDTGTLWNNFKGNMAAAAGVSNKTDRPAYKKAQIMDFNFDEGLYLDSKTVTFSCTWRIICSQQYIMLASGLWTKCAEEDDEGNNLWATTVQGISGHKSWLENSVNSGLDVIVDFGGG